MRRRLVIGGVELPTPLVLAPMAGICDRYFRRMIRRVGGVGLVSMEFISAEAVTRGIRPIIEKMAFSDAERPLAIQIYGSDPERMAECAAVVDALGPEICDINMGCPANKVLKGCAGAALMADLGLAARIIEACRRRLNRPLTVKFRLGLGRRDDEPGYLELGRICEDLGVAAITLHARTARQMYTGRADWNHIRRLKESVSIPVIGNGDVFTADDAMALFESTGCDGVMAGRGVLRDPWLFRRIAARLEGSPEPEVSLEDRKSLMLEHFRWVAREEPPPVALHKMRTFAGRYTKGLAGGRALRERLGKLADPSDFLDALEEHFC
ncbi:MAG: tRNA dihydrouridine synthase DusB [Acidobacteriota bacterium]|nr:tRNA dihydrouridine synthase DusB [Acidobacteriota bacterium]MDQ7087311.1 tRNA dihydrouridine synthase DusB [Acidobacteriota bacterium]